MNIRLVIEAEVRFVEGKFAPRDELAEALVGEVENADPGSLSAGEGEYEVDDFSVYEEAAPRGKVCVWMTPKQAEKWNAAKAGAR